MPDILVRNVPAEIVEVLERVAGRRKREGHVRELLVKAGERALLGEGRLLMCLEDFIPPLSSHEDWLPHDPDPHLNLLFRRGIISNPRTRGRLLPKSMWTEGPALLEKLAAAHLVLPVPFFELPGDPFEYISATLSDAVAARREPPHGFFEMNGGDTGIVPEPSFLSSAVGELEGEPLGRFGLVANSFARMMGQLAERVRNEAGERAPPLRATNLDRLVARGTDVIESLVLASRAAAAGERLHGCMVHPDAVAGGMHPSEAYLTLGTGEEHPQHVSVSRRAMFGSCYPVGEPVGSGADGRILVDLGRETDSGSHRVWMPPQAVIPVRGPHEGGDNLVAADVRGLAGALVDAARAYRVSMPLQASRAGYIGGLLGMVAESGVGGRLGVNVEILRVSAAG